MQPEIDYQRIGQRVRQARQRANLTQEQLSERVECSNIHISHIESGQTKVSLGLLLRLSYALESSLDYFLLDTPYAPREAVLSEELSQKLVQCDRTTLLAVSRMVDVLLEQQKALRAEYEE